MFVSVCIPTYNRPEMVLFSVQSVLNQTHTNFELLIHDNSENDDTEKIIMSLDDSRIFYHRHPKNVGIAKNWNSLLSAAHGEYVKFLNDDDVLLPDCLEVIIEKLSYAKERFGTIGVITCRAEYMNINHKLIKLDAPKGIGFESDYYIHEKDVAAFWMNSSIPLRTPTHSTYHRDMALSLGGFDEKLDYSRDVFLALKLGVEAGALILDKRPLVRFVIHASQDVKGISANVRTNNLLYMKEWSAKQKKETNTKILNVIYGEICLREAMLMLKGWRINDMLYALKKYAQYDNKLSALINLINNDFLYKLTKRKLYHYETL